jgi:hypothetical protein
MRGHGLSNYTENVFFVRNKFCKNINGHSFISKESYFNIIMIYKEQSFLTQKNPKR